MSRSTANLTLYRGWLSPNQYVWSPFVTKPEARLRFAGIPYETKAGWVRSAPRGKIPYIDISQAGETTQIGDSSLIIKDLVDRGILPDINGELDAEGRARDLALRALMEEKLNFYHVGRPVISCLLFSMDLSDQNKRARDDGFRIIMPCVTTPSVLSRTLFAWWSGSWSTAVWSKHSMGKGRDGTRMMRSGVFEEKPGRGLMIYLPRRGRMKGGKSHFGSWGEMGRVRRMRRCLDLRSRSWFARRKF